MCGLPPGGRERGDFRSLPASKWEKWRAGYKSFKKAEKDRKKKRSRKNKVLSPKQQANLVNLKAHIQRAQKIYAEEKTHGMTWNDAVKRAKNQAAAPTTTTTTADVKSFVAT